VILAKKKPSTRSTRKPSKPKRPSVSDSRTDPTDPSYQPDQTDLSTAKPPSRPPGSKNIPRDEVMCEPSRCKTCKSTNRTAYLGNPTVEFAPGKDINGNPFTHVISRRTECADCGQARRDISYMNDPSRTSTELRNELAEG
jgi:nitrate reductase cytochrome c-type subunit